MSSALRSACMAVLVACCMSGGLRQSARADTPPPHVHVLSLGLWGPNPLFKREAIAAASVIAAHFGHRGQVVVLANTPIRSAAHINDVRTAIAGLASAIDIDNDVVVIFLTSHGNDDGVAVATVDNNRVTMMSPSQLNGMLDANRIRNKIIIVSACYSGVFSDTIANDHTLVITAADSRHSSFGCEDDNKGDYTWFGQALFGDSLRPGVTLADAFDHARSEVTQREASEHFENSNPQMRGGKAVLERLRGLEQ